MRSGDDDATVRTAHAHCQLGCRSRGQSDVHHIDPDTHQRSAYHVLDHRTGDTCVAADDDLQFLPRMSAGNERSVCRSEFNNIQRVQRIARTTSDSATDAGN